MVVVMTTPELESIIGPRVPQDEIIRHGLRYGLPNLLLMAARVLLLVSLFFPYWRMHLEAPQYPGGLRVQAYVNHLEGDVAEIDNLNHYIGMRPLEEAAQFERAASVWLIIAMVLLVEGAAFIHNRWAALLAAPAVLFPAFFLADLYLWLNHFGQNLDPDAPLSASVKPFTPPLLGVGTVGQFRTIASAGEGLILAAAAAGITLVALYFHRRAYKPLVEAARGRDS
jgi:copper chaperone NosL